MWQRVLSSESFSIFFLHVHQIEILSLVFSLFFSLRLPYSPSFDRPTIIEFWKEIWMFWGRFQRKKRMLRGEGGGEEAEAERGRQVFNFLSSAKS